MTGIFPEFQIPELPPGQLAVKFGNCKPRRLSRQFHWSRLSADLQYKIELYKYQHLSDFKASWGFLQMRLSSVIHVLESWVFTQFAPTGCSPSMCPQDTRRKATGFYRGDDFALFQVPPAMHYGWSSSDFHREKTIYVLQFTPHLQTLLFSFKHAVEKLHLISSTTDNGRKSEKRAEVMKKSTVGEIKIKGNVWSMLFFKKLLLQQH